MSENSTSRYVKSVLPTSEELSAMKVYADVIYESKCYPDWLYYIDKKARVVRDETALKALILRTILKGWELDLSPQRTFDNISMISNKYVMEGQLMLSIIRTKMPNATISIVQCDNLASVIKAKRPEETELTEFRYDQSDAKIAGLWGKDGPWTTTPSTQMQWRNIARICRIKFPDVIQGSYLPDEAETIPMPDNAKAMLSNTTKPAALGKPVTAQMIEDKKVETTIKTEKPAVSPEVKTEPVKQEVKEATKNFPNPTEIVVPTLELMQQTTVELGVSKPVEVKPAVNPPTETKPVEVKEKKTRKRSTSKQEALKTVKEQTVIPAEVLKESGLVIDTGIKVEPIKVPVLATGGIVSKETVAVVNNPPTPEPVKTEPVKVEQKTEVKPEPVKIEVKPEVKSTMVLNMEPEDVLSILNDPAVQTPVVLNPNPFGHYLNDAIYQASKRYIGDDFYSSTKIPEKAETDIPYSVLLKLAKAELTTLKIDPEVITPLYKEVIAKRPGAPVAEMLYDAIYTYFERTVKKDPKIVPLFVDKMNKAIEMIVLKLLPDALKQPLNLDQFITYMMEKTKWAEPQCKWIVEFLKARNYVKMSIYTNDLGVGMTQIEMVK